jgi:hypothetical protein
VNGEWAVLPFLYSEIMPVSVRHLVPLIFVMTLALGAALARGATLFLAAALPRGATLSLATALPHGATLSLAAALTRGAAASPWTVWPLAMVVIPYVVLNLAASTQVAWRERKLSFLATMPMVFVTLHVSYGLGSACGLLQVVSQVIREKLARRAIVSGSRSGRDKTTVRETSETPAADVAMVALKAMIAPNRIVAAEPVEEVACLPRN